MGLYSYGKSSMFLKVRAYTLYLVLLVLTTISIIMKTLTSRSPNNMEMNAMLIYISDCTSICFKLLPFLQNSENIKRCINFFEEKDFAPKTDHENKIIDECIRVCHRNSTLYFYSALMAVIGWNIPAFFAKGRKLPLRLWLPYDPSSTTMDYYFTLVFIAAGIKKLCTYTRTEIFIYSNCV